MIIQVIAQNSDEAVSGQYPGCLMQNGRFNEHQGFNYSFLCLKDRTQNNPRIQFEEVT